MAALTSHSFCLPSSQWSRGAAEKCICTALKLPVIPVDARFESTWSAIPLLERLSSFSMDAMHEAHLCWVDLLQCFALRLVRRFLLPLSQVCPCVVDLPLAFSVEQPLIHRTASSGHDQELWCLAGLGGLDLETKITFERFGEMRRGEAQCLPSS